MTAPESTEADALMTTDSKSEDANLSRRRDTMNTVTSSTTYNGPASSWQFATYRVNGKTVQLPVEVRGERITLQVAPYKP